MTPLVRRKKKRVVFVAKNRTKILAKLLAVIALCTITYLAGLHRSPSFVTRNDAITYIEIGYDARCRGAFLSSVINDVFD